MKILKKLLSTALLFGLAQGSLHALDMENVYINGFFSQGYLKSSANSFGGDTEDGTWEFNEAAISVRAMLSDELTAGIQLMSRDFGISGNNDLVVDWAFLDYRSNDALGFRVGKFKKPEGIYNSIRDADSVRTAILLPQGIYAEDQRDLNIAVQGIGIYGFLDLDSGGSLDYTAYLGNQPIDQDSPILRNGLLAGLFGIQSGGNIESKYLIGCQVFWNTPVAGLRLGQAFNTSKMEINGINSTYPWYSSDIVDGESNTKIKAITSISYQSEKYSIAAEYLIQKIEMQGSPIGGSITPFGFPSGGEYKIEWQSYYLQFNYVVTDQFELGTYYSLYYRGSDGEYDRDDPASYSKDWAVSAKYTINDWWLLKAEMHFIDGMAHANADESGVLEKNWNLIAVKSTISF